MKKVPYTAIKTFAVHDGPGIRTTLFLKGCSMHCVWCHNPENISPRPQLAIHDSQCRLCGECAAVCKNHQIVRGEHLFDRNACTACGKCEEHCLSGTLELFGKTISVETAAQKLLEDKMFYAEEGGITVSGGEPLLQSEFCAELFARMKKEGVSCILDTCGHVPWSAFEEVLPGTDMFLYDFKCADPEKHRAFTGCRNDLLLENLKKLNDRGKRIEIRMILVPRYNMDQIDLRAAGEFLAPLKNISAVRLLAYHAMARSKYRAVGCPDTMPDVPAPDAEALESAAGLLRQYDLNVINSLL